MKWLASPHLSVIVLWSPWGVHTCKGRNWAELFNPEVPSGPPLPLRLTPVLSDLSLAPIKTEAFRLSDCALITDHQPQWTINLNQGHHHKPLLHFFGTSCAEILINVFHEQACTKNRVERFHCQHCLSPMPRALGKRDRSKADRASFNTLKHQKKKKNLPELSKWAM